MKFFPCFGTTTEIVKQDEVPALKAKIEALERVAIEKERVAKIAAAFQSLPMANSVRACDKCGRSLTAASKGRQFCAGRPSHGTSINNVWAIYSNAGAYIRYATECAHGWNIEHLTTLCACGYAIVERCLDSK